MQQGEVGTMRLKPNWLQRGNCDPQLAEGTCDSRVDYQSERISVDQLGRLWTMWRRLHAFEGD